MTVRKVLFSLFIIVAGFSVFTINGYADQQTVFGPEDLIIKGWRIHLSTHQVAVDEPCDGELILRKNTPGLRIRSGFVVLNRTFISIRQFLRSDSLQFNKAVQLKKGNRVSVFLFGQREASLQIEIRGKSVLPPEVTFSADPQSIRLGESSALSWSAANADACHIEPGIGDVAAQGTFTVSPSGTTTYTITATGSGGSASATTTVTVHQPPTVSLTASPETIAKGDLIVLSWNSTHADSAVIDPGIGSVTVNGSLSVTPDQTGAYTIRVSGPGGSATASVLVTVVQPDDPPYINLTGIPEKIAPGESATLSWMTVNANTVYIDNGIGIVNLTDSLSVSPTHTTTYVLTATGQGGSTSASVTLEVLGNPVPQPMGSFGGRYNDLIPQNATLAAYEENRFAIITGQVQDIEDIPIENVSVSILDHPEYGTVKSNSEGIFSIPAEGGLTLTVVYKKEGFIPAHRKVYTAWNDTAVAESIQMITEDPLATTITFDGNPETITTHQSTRITDESGSRSASMVFSGDNRAYLVDEDGNDVIELTTITTRATEFTTPASMPAKLPPNSGYTYCVELAVDGAPRVRFEKPVVTGVDNFLGFDVGMAVPIGYYDRDRGVWVPVDNGVVVKLLDTDSNGIVDALDANGDDLPDDLDADGAFNDEVEGLDDPLEYSPGSTFWRVVVSHFTPWDCNWPFGPPDDFVPPNAQGVAIADSKKEKIGICPVEFGSYAESRSRIFHEDISIPGTGIDLHYASNRVPGYQNVINIPASGPTVPASLKHIVVNVRIAGRNITQFLEPLPDQTAEVTWDGLDYLGNPVFGPVTAGVDIGFVYDMVYMTPGDFQRAFAQAGGSVTAVRGRSEITSWKRNQLMLHRSKGTIAQGWTISPHHQISADNPSVLFKGDGNILDRNKTNLIGTIAGTGAGFSGDGGPADQARLRTPYRVDVNAAGEIFIADTNNYRIRKIDADGIITTIAGTGSSGFSGDGGLAVNARLSRPQKVVCDNKGNLYITDFDNRRVRKIDANGIITTVAGNGGNSYAGDGVLATQTGLYGPAGLAVSDDGELYISISYRGRVVKVDTDGIISTLDPGSLGLLYPSDVAVDHKGNVYIANRGRHTVGIINAEGVASRFAGTSRKAGYSGDGGLAVNARLSKPSGVAVDRAGNVYIADTGNRCVRKVDTSGIITTVAGTPTASGFSGDGGPATTATIKSALGVAISPAGDLLIADSDNHRIRRVSIPGAFSSVPDPIDNSFADENGTGYTFSGAGLHESTIDTDTGAALYTFGYNGSNEIDSFTDRFGNQTRVERDASGVPTAIISPDGLQTDLTIDSSNQLTRITYPDGSYYDFEYTPDGLMTAEIEPAGNRFDHTFNDTGRLTYGYDEEGGLWNYSRTSFENGDILSEVTTGEGNVTTYLDRTDSTGAYTSTITGATGDQTLFSQSADALTVDKTLACGMDLDFTYEVDPEYKYRIVKSATQSTPSGLTQITTRDKAYEDTDADLVPDLITQTVTVNGKAATLVHNTLAAQKIVTSPAGRTVTSLYDPDTLLTETVSVPGLFDTTYSYDARGRLTTVSTNTRQTTFAYNAEGFLGSISDPENRTTTYGYDAVGRITGITRPDNSFLDFTYDSNGNMTVLTNPAGIDHEFGFNTVNRNSSYTTPLSGSYSYVYDKDRRLVQTNFPSGAAIINDYADPEDPADKSRLWQIRTPEGNIDFTYLCGTKIDSITKGVEVISYTYDGKLVTSETLGGTLGQTIDYSYNNDFDLTSLTYAGASTSFAYDNDGLLTGAGNFTITRNVQNGLPEAVADLSLGLGRTFNGYGEVDGQTHTVGGQNNASWTLVRDNNGRITQKTETVNGATSIFDYTYDAAGRLLTVTKDSVLVEEYQYDSAGTRSYEMNSLRGIAGRDFTYSDEDHLLSAGSVTYNYDLDGFLTTKTDGSDVTSYSYSFRGELLSVTLPDGRQIEYVHDPLGRRTAKKINSSIVEKYLWQGLTRLLAVYDASDTLLMRFEYADGRMPVAMASGGSTYYLSYDQVGSLRLVLDSTGNVVKSVEYDSFGNILNDSNPTFAVPFGFAGGSFDRDIGLVRFGYRDYDPDVGRWTAKDPILLTGGDADLYGYVLNNPVNFIDPLGLAGIAIDFGGDYTTGWGGKVDPNAFIRQGGTAGTGIYIGAKEGGHAEIGGFTYQSVMTDSGKTPAASLGAGANITIYLTDAEKFFPGKMKYINYVIGPFAMTFSEDPCTGELTAVTGSFLGKGFGWVIHEEGVSDGLQGALQ